MWRQPHHKRCSPLPSPLLAITSLEDPLQSWWPPSLLLPCSAQHGSPLVPMTGDEVSVLLNAWRYIISTEEESIRVLCIQPACNLIFFLGRVSRAKVAVAGCHSNAGLLHVHHPPFMTTCPAPGSRFVSAVLQSVWFGWRPGEWWSQLWCILNPGAWNCDTISSEDSTSQGTIHSQPCKKGYIWLVENLALSAIVWFESIHHIQWCS